MIKLVLFSWPIMVIVLFRRLALASAIAASVIGGYLLLPTRGGIDLPLLPPFNKNSIPVMMAMIMAGLALKARPNTPGILDRWLPRNRITLALMAAMLLGALFTAYTNGRAQVFGPRVLKGLTLYDGFSNALEMIVGLLPLILARRFLGHPDNHKALLWVLCIAGLLYSLPTLYEVRMSPQLNRMLYGYFPNSWVQHLRDGGFRPIVFLQHGLWLGVFLGTTVIATAAVFRFERGRSRAGLALMATLWLLGTLVLSKNFGATGATLLLLPVVLFFKPRGQLLAAAIIAGIVLGYPAVRAVGLVPINTVLSTVRNIDADRAASFQYRLTNEDLLLRKAQQKPLFGWGKWGRSRVIDERGRDRSTIDGGWILVLGEGGWVRYLSQMGLLAAPILLLGWHRKRYDISLATAGLAVALTVNLIDLIPNDTLTPITWLIAGALWGRIELGQIKETAALQDTAPKPVSAYTRQTKHITRATRNRV